MNRSTCGGVRNTSTCDCSISSALNECRWEPAKPFGVELIVIVAFFYVVVFVMACLWNTLVIAIFIKNRHRLQEPSSLFLFTLAVVDILEAISSIPFYITALIGGGWIIGDTDATRERTCVALGFIFGVFLLATVHLLALISFDRFLYIVHPLKYGKWMNLPKALCLAGMVLSVPVVLASLPFFGFGKLGYSPFIGVCVFRWEGERNYVLTIAIEALFPTVATIIFTLWTYIHAKRFLRRRNARQMSYSFPKELVHSVSIKNQELERTLTHTFFLLLFSQAVCFAPGIVTAIVGFFVGYVNIPTPIYIIDFLIIVSSVAINPIIQSLSRTQIRKYVKKLFHKLKCCWHMQSLQTESHELQQQEDTRCSSDYATNNEQDNRPIQALSQCNATTYIIDPIRGTLV